MGGRVGWGVPDSPAHAREVRTGPKCHSTGSVLCPRGPASSSAHSDKGPLPQALCPTPATTVQREGTVTNASHRSRLTGEGRPGLTAGTAEGLWTSWVRLWSASPRMTPPPQAQTRPLAKEAQNRSGGSTGLSLLNGHHSAASHACSGLRRRL